MGRFIVRLVSTCLLFTGLAGVFIPASAVAVTQQYYSLNALPMPPNSSGWQVVSREIDSAGDVVAAATESGGFQHTLIWPHGSGTVLQPDDYAVLQDMTPNGVVLYEDPHDGQFHRYTISNKSDTVLVTTILSVNAINDQNPRMVVGETYPNGNIPVASEAPEGSTNVNQNVDLGFGIDSTAAAINNVGDVAGSGSCSNHTECAYFYDHTTGRATVIGPTSSNTNDTMTGSDINASGEVIGQSWSNGGFNRPPFIFTMTDGLQILGTGTASNGVATGINDGGDVVGEVDGMGAVIWPAGSTDPVSLSSRIAQTDLTGWSLSSASDINDNGVIAAFGLLNGQSTAFLLTPVQDGTPPTSTGAVVNGSGNAATPNGSGWYRDDTLKLHVTVADDPDGLGLGSLTVTVNGTSSTTNLARNGQSLDAISFSEGTSTVSYYATDWVGNAETAHNLTVKYDKTAPTWKCDGTPTDWQKGNVQLNCTADDSVSGVASPGTQITLSTNVADGAETDNASTDSVDLCDVAGNCTQAQLTGLEIDNAAPQVTCDRLDVDWHANDVSIDCTASDGGSGLADGSNAEFSLSTSVASGTETASATTNIHTVCDAVGNCTTVGPFGPAKVDKKNPSISGAPTTSPNADDWYDTSVVIHWTCSDSGSGVASCPTDQTLNSEGTDQTVSGSATDNVGNTASVNSNPAVNIDLTAPTVTYTGNQSSYSVDKMVNISCSASDNLSGVASTTCQNISGPAYGFALGQNAFSATATDVAGNTGAGFVSFTVDVTGDSLCALTTQFVGSSSQAKPLCAPITGTNWAVAMHNAKLKSAMVNVYITLVNHERGLTNQQKSILTQLAENL
jgi:hypothetical protein